MVVGEVLQVGQGDAIGMDNRSVPGPTAFNSISHFVRRSGIVPSNVGSAVGHSCDCQSSGTCTGGSSMNAEFVNFNTVAHVGDTNEGCLVVGVAGRSRKRHILTGP